MSSKRLRIDPFSGRAKVPDGFGKECEYFGKIIIELNGGGENGTDDC